MQAKPTRVESVRDYLSLAEACVESPVWRYLQDGSGDTSVAENERAFAAVRLMPRPLCDLRGGHSRLSLFGQSWAHPILLAPIAYQRLFHPEGECATAMAASAQGSPLVISSLASQPLEEIARAGRLEDGSGPWFQLYWQGNRERTQRLLQRAMAAGCSVVVLTVDAPVKKATLELPTGIAAVNLEPFSSPSPGAGQSTVFDGWMAQAPSWDDVAWLRQHFSGPLLLKGILHPDDAEQAVSLGCDGVVVSNHGGRVLDGAPASLEVLPLIVKRLAGRVPVLLDSGIRSGRDVFAALAFGATAVLVGRPYIWGLASKGAMGVAHAIRLLRDELEMTMALTGCARLECVGLDCLRSKES